MNNKQIIKKIKVLIMFCIVEIIVICFFARETYSNFIYKVESDIELKINKLNYNIKINDIETNSVLISSGNSIVNLKIISNNDISTYYKLLFLENPNIDIYYIDSNPYGLIKSNEEINIKLYVINKNNTMENIKFIIGGGYNTNNINDIIIESSYKEINKQIKVGDYIEYKPNGVENITKYIIDSKYSGVTYNQEVYLLNSRYKIFSINDDGSIDIISEESLFIDSNNNKLKVNGVKGYNNFINILNSMMNSLYGNSDYVINSKNLGINSIVSKLKNVPFYIKNEYLLNDIYYPDISSNNYLFGKTNIIENYYILDLSKNNFNDKIYYELINDSEEYYLLDKYIIKDSYIRYGVYSIVNDSIKYNDLYLSDNSERIYSFKIRPMITLSSYTNIKYDSDKWIIE